MKAGLDDALDVGKGAFGIAPAGPLQGLLKKIDLAGRVFEERREESGEVIVRYVAECIREGLIEALCESVSWEVMGNELQQ